MSSVLPPGICIGRPGCCRIDGELTACVVKHDHKTGCQLLGKIELTFKLVVYIEKMSLGIHGGRSANHIAKACGGGLDYFENRFAFATQTATGAA